MALQCLRVSVSPLQVRTSWRRLQNSPQALKLLRRLLWPVPWRLPPQAPLTVAELQDHGKEVVNFRQSGILQLHAVPLFIARDGPLASVYRLYEDICCGNLIMMGYECAYLFYHKRARWQLSRIPDPKDPDPVRRAVLASMVEALVDAFNWRLKLGLRRDYTRDESENRATNFEPEEAPAWVHTVQPLPQTLDLIIGPEGKPMGNPHAAFMKRNIEAPMGYLYTV